MFAAIHQRISHYCHAGRLIVRFGGTVTSGLLYPFRRRLSRDPRCQIDFKNKCSITSPPDTPLLDLIDEIWIRRCYFRNEFQLRKGATVVDIGANVGAFSVLVAMADPKSKIIAVEPDLNNVAFLYRNIARNRLQNVTVVTAACGGKNGDGTLYMRGAGVLHSLFCRDMQGSDFKPLCKIPIITLDDVFFRFGVECCDLLKLDCEGSEYDVLLNASPQTMSRITRIALEYHVGFNDHSPDELKTFLESSGFKVEWLPMREDGTGFLYAVSENIAC